MPHCLMRAEAAFKNRIKPLLFADEAKPRMIRAGLGRGLVMLLNRRSEFQKELGIWEIEAQRAYREHVRRGAVIYDVGAAAGDSKLLARLAAPGRVAAFEPDEDLCALLERNIALNPGLTNIQIVRRFVGRADGEVNMVSLDAMIADRTIPGPDFVKIDVDGAEEHVLAGMAETMRTDPPVLLVEVHGGDLERRCRDLLASCRYEVRTIRNAWWRMLYPEYRPIGLNRWLLGIPEQVGTDTHSPG